jgi:hypothetical protein
MGSPSKRRGPFRVDYRISQSDTKEILGSVSDELRRFARQTWPKECEQIAAIEAVCRSVAFFRYVSKCQRPIRERTATFQACRFALHGTPSPVDSLGQARLAEALTNPVMYSLRRVREAGLLSNDENSLATRDDVLEALLDHLAQIRVPAGS